jgi:hypothetical protein
MKKNTRTIPKKKFIGFPLVYVFRNVIDKFFFCVFIHNDIKNTSSNQSLPGLICRTVILFFFLRFLKILILYIISRCENILVFDLKDIEVKLHNETQAMERFSLKYIYYQ